MKALPKTVAIGAALLTAFSAKAIPFELKTSLADLTGAGVGPGTYYKENLDTGEEGSEAAKFTTTFGDFKDGDPSEPLSALITWTGDQPVLIEAYLKAATTLYTWTDPGALAAFNLGSYDGIKFIHDASKNAISHVALLGDDREPPDEVPDTGSALLLLGAASLVVGVARKLVK